MTTDPRLCTRDARRTANHLLEVLQRERITGGAAATDREPCEVDANPALIEQARGALMLHYGVDSHQAFAVLLGWARMSGTPVTTIAHALLRGICEGNPNTEVRHRVLMQWLEAQLRAGDPAHALLRTAPVRAGPGRAMRFRARVECGDGCVQGRDSRSHALLHRHVTTPRRTRPCRVFDLSRSPEGHTR